MKTILLSGCSVVSGRPPVFSRAVKRLPTLVPGLVGLASLALFPSSTHGSYRSMGTGLVVTGVAAAPGGGFWVQWDNPDKDGGLNASDGGATVATNGAPAFQNVKYEGSIAAIPGQNKYWVVTPNGFIIDRGGAPRLCDGDLNNCSGFPDVPISTQFIVAAAAHPSGNGLWAVGRDGAVWTAGEAESYGDVQFDGNVPTGIVATPSGKGYYIVMDNGGVHARGDAVFYGSTGGNPPGGHQITGIALSIGDDGNVNGYWLVASDGGVHTFGSAPFWGSTGGDNSGSEVTGIVSFPAPVPGQPPQRTRGYAWVNMYAQVTAVYGTHW
jgi:hypothetical protein